MSKHKQMGKDKDGKDKDKGVQLVVRIAKSERAAFVALCEDLDTTAAREIRRFMREFVAARSPVVAADSTPDDAVPTAEPSPLPIVEPAEAAAEPAAEPVMAETAAEDAAPKKTRKRVKA